MSSFSVEYFKLTKFTADQISGYLAKSLKDLEIAEKNPIVEVRFTFAYQALIKLN